MTRRKSLCMATRTDSQLLTTFESCNALFKIPPPLPPPPLLPRQQDGSLIIFLKYVKFNKFNFTDYSVFTSWAGPVSFLNLSLCSFPLPPRVCGGRGGEKEGEDKFAEGFCHMPHQLTHTHTHTHGLPSIRSRQGEGGDSRMCLGGRGSQGKKKRMGEILENHTRPKGPFLPLPRPPPPPRDGANLEAGGGRKRMTEKNWHDIASCVYIYYIYVYIFIYIYLSICLGVKRKAAAGPIQLTFFKTWKLFFQSQ